MAENKIRKIDLTSSPKPSRAYGGPASSGIEHEVSMGLVLNPANQRVGKPDNAERVLLHDPRKFVRFFDDFLGDALADQWNFREGTDSSTTDAAITVAAGGVLRLTTGDDSGASLTANGIQLESALNFQANMGNLFFEARVRLSAITSVAVFLGFTDQASSLEMPFTLGGGNALTSNATDAVGFLFDTAADTDRWFAVGVKNDVDAAKQDLGVAPVASTWETFRVEVDKDGHAMFFRNGVLIGVQMRDALRPNVGLTPVVVGFSRTNATRTIDLDYIDVGASRA